MSQEYVWLCLTVGTKLGKEDVAEHNIWCRISLVGFLLLLPRVTKSGFRA